MRHEMDRHIFEIHISYATRIDTDFLIQCTTRFDTDSGRRRHCSTRTRKTADTNETRIYDESAKTKRQNILYQVKRGPGWIFSDLRHDTARHGTRKVIATWTDTECFRTKMGRHGLTRISKGVQGMQSDTECDQVNGEPIWSDTDYQHVKPERTDLKKTTKTKHEAGNTTRMHP